MGFGIEPTTDKWGVKHVTHCAMPDCHHRPFAATEDRLREALVRWGWAETEHGWICPEHLRFARAAAAATA